jgi:CBS domain-containing protein
VIYSTIAGIINERPLASIHPTASVREACQVMCRLDVRAVVVQDQSRLVGVLSERDVIQKCVCPERHTGETLVNDVMTTDPKTLNENDSLAAALELMAEGRFHHVPVLRDRQVVGLLSADDIPEEYRMLLERFKEIRGR